MRHKNIREDTNFNSMSCGHYHRCYNIAPGVNKYQMLPIEQLLNMLSIFRETGFKVYVVLLVEILK